MKLFRLALLGVGIAAALALAGVGLPGRAHGDSTPTRSITVSGNGSVNVTPNQAAFTFGVSTKARTAVRALAADSAATSRLIDALKAAGIAAGSLQTAYVSLSPLTSQDGSEITGYSASNSVTATIDGVGRAGEIVDAAVAAGADQVDGPSPTVADQTALYASALKAAIADARAKAQVLAAASGLHVGSVTSVQESVNGSPVNYDTAKAAFAATPIEPGTQEVSASATVVFDAS